MAGGFLSPITGGDFKESAKMLSPLAFAMASGLRSGQGAATYAPQGLAAMMAMQEREEAKQKEAREEVARKEELARAERMTADALRTGVGLPTRNEALEAGGGPTRAAATAMGGQQEFVRSMWPHAVRVSRATGLDPRLVVGVAAQETGWGQSAPNNNYFGIKSHGAPGGTTLSTKEYVDGAPVTVSDSFRGYGSIGESADDYASFLMQNPRYQGLLGAQGLDAQIEALGASGYATDPNYAANVGSIARGIQAPGGRVSPERAAAILSNLNVPDAVKQRVLSGYFPSQDRRIIEGADGFKYYEDTGERVLPGVEMSPQPGNDYERYAARERAAGREPDDEFEYRRRINATKKEPSMIVGTDANGNPIYATGAAASNVKLTETQSKDNVYATRMRGALDILDQRLEDGSYLSDALTSRGEEMAERVPMGIGREFQSDSFQVAQQAGQDFILAFLRKDTGAAVTPSEEYLYGRTYLPQPGDGDAVLEVKRQARERALQAVESGMNPFQIAMRDRALIESARANAERRQGRDPAPEAPPEFLNAQDRELWEFMEDHERAAILETYK